MNLKNKLMWIGSAALPIIIVLVIFFSPYDFDYLLSKVKLEKFEDNDKENELDKSLNKTSHKVDIPVKNAKCTVRGKDFVSVQEFMEGKTMGCYKGKAFY
jgi:hypothetical protein